MVQRKSPIQTPKSDQTGPLEDVEPVSVSFGESAAETPFEGTPDAGPGTDDIAGPGDYDQDSNDDLLDGVAICTRAEFRTWYAGRFHLANMILAPFVGGPLMALNLDEHDETVERAADGLYDEAKRRRWRFLIKKSSGTWPVIETQGGLFFVVISAVASEIAERRVQAQAKAEAEAHGGKAQGSGETETAANQDDLDQGRKAQARDQDGKRVYG